MNIVYAAARFGRFEDCDDNEEGGRGYQFAYIKGLDTEPAPA